MRLKLLLALGAIALVAGCQSLAYYTQAIMGHSKVMAKARPLDECVEEVLYLQRLGARHIAFYDDALLFKPERIIMPFLESLLRHDVHLSLHTPNALNARFITRQTTSLWAAGQ